jgi:hypothetical protein
MTHDDARPGGPAIEGGACPLCAGLAALRQARPEAVEHLVRAGTELLLAVRALLEAPPADRPAPRPAADPRLRRIDVG